MNTSWHFYIMILASFILFFGVLRMVLGGKLYKTKLPAIALLSTICVVLGMLLGKYGAMWGLPWWIYYPVPMLLNVILPPVILKMKKKQAALYWVLGILSAPFIHALFSFFLNWHEYMPFWEIPYIFELC